MAGANIPITSLPPAVGLSRAAIVPVVLGGVTSRTTAGDIADLAAPFVPTSRAINTPSGGGLTGGGTLVTDLTLSLSLGGLVNKTVPIVADSVVINDSVSGDPQRVTLDNFYKSIAGLSIIASPVATDDYLALYDANTGDVGRATIQDAFASVGTLPSGGTIGQLLKKSSSTNFDAAWSSTGFVTSVDLTAGTGISVSGGPITGSGAITVTLANTAVTAGSYGSASQSPSFTADAQGRLTAAANVTITPTAIGAVPTTRTVNTSTGLSGGGALSGDLTLSLANTAVAAGSYGDSTHVAAITVDGQGRLTTAASTAISLSGLGGVPSTRTLTGGTGINAIGDLSANRTVSIADTAVVPGSYGTASTVGTFTVDQQGRLTAATPTAITPAAIGAVPTTRTVNTATGLTGGGALSSDLTLNYNIPALTAKASPDSSNDLLLLYSNSDNAYRKVTVGSVAAGGTVASFNGRTGVVVPATGDYGVTQLAATTANRLFGTNGSGNSGLIAAGSAILISGSSVAVANLSDANVSSGAAISSAKLSYLSSLTSSVARSVNSKESDFVSIADFAAVPNVNTAPQIAANTTAIQAALNSGAVSVYRPAGDFYCGIITIPTTCKEFWGPGNLICGVVVGIGSTFVLGTSLTDFLYSGGEISLSHVDSPDGNAFALVSCTSSGIADTVIPEGGSIGVYFNACTDCFGEQIYVTNFNTCAIRRTDCINTRVLSCTVYALPTTASNPVSVDGSGANNDTINNYIDAQACSGWPIRYDEGQDGGDIFGNTIRNTKFENITVAGKNVRIFHNDMDCPSLTSIELGMSFDGSSGHVIDNLSICYNTIRRAGKTAIYLANYCTNCTVADNDIIDCNTQNGSTEGNGIEVQGSLTTSSGHLIRDNRIRNLTATGKMRYGLRENSFGLSNTWVNNQSDGMITDLYLLEGSSGSLTNCQKQTFTTTTINFQFGSGYSLSASLVYYISGGVVNVSGTVSVITLGTGAGGISLLLPVAGSSTYGGGSAGVNVSNGIGCVGAVNPASPFTLTLLPIGAANLASGNSQTIAFSTQYVSAYG